MFVTRDGAFAIWDVVYGTFSTKKCDDLFLFSSGLTLLKAVPFAFSVEKVLQLEKSTPPTVVVVVINMSYGWVPPVVRSINNEKECSKD